MSDPEFPPIDLSRTIGDLAPRNLILVESFRGALVSLLRQHGPADRVAVRMRVAPFGSRKELAAPADATLAEWARRQGIVPAQAFEVPAVDWWTEEEPRIITATGPISLDAARLRAGAAEPVLPSAPARPSAPATRVDAIKETYGRLRGDIAYRIENAALFDPAVPLTAQFETALVLWADVEPATPAAEVARRASMVQVTFNAARAHAETVGLGHLPADARPDADRAAKAARLARATDSAAERATALARVITILRSLALYYLPDPEAVDRALTAGPSEPQPEASRL